MYAYIDRKKKLPVTTLLRAIGFEGDKDILEIFGLADEIKVSKAALKKVVGRKLAARVLKSWIEDFVDEDTGEVVSIERNEVIIDRETILENEHIDEIVDSGAKTILLHKESTSVSDYALIYNTLQKTHVTQKKRQLFTSIVSCVMQIRRMMLPHVTLLINCSFLTSVTTLEMLVATELTRNWVSTLTLRQGYLQGKT